MASFVKKSVKITWEDKDYIINITNELGNTLESIDINLWVLYVSIVRGETPKLFLVSNLMANILRAAAELDVSQDAVKDFITSNPPNVAEFIGQYREVVLAFFSKNDEDKPVGKSQKGKSKK